MTVITSPLWTVEVCNDTKYWRTDFRLGIVSYPAPSVHDVEGTFEADFPVCSHSLLTHPSAARPQHFFSMIDQTLKKWRSEVSKLPAQFTQPHLRSNPHVARRTNLPCCPAHDPPALAGSLVSRARHDSIPTRFRMPFTQEHQRFQEML